MKYGRYGAILVIALALMPSFLGAQVVEDWVKWYRSPVNLNDWANALATDAGGNVYVTGASESTSTGNDYLTIKCDVAGNELWRRRYCGPGGSSDWPYSIAVDLNGNVYVAGSSDSAGGDYLTLKYNSAGVLQWARRYDSGHLPYWHDFPRAMRVDPAGNAYVTGYSGPGSFEYDYLTVKYSPSGVLEWARSYDGPAHTGDYSYAMALDGEGNVLVTGGSDSLGTNSDYLTIKYSSGGSELWRRRKAGLGFGVASGIAVDRSDNVYVAGTMTVNDSGRFGTVKYDPNGNELWTAYHDGPGNSGSEARAIALDPAGNALVAGSSYDVVPDTYESYFETVKYNQTGDEMWSATLDAPGFIAEVVALAVDRTGNVYVGGQSSALEGRMSDLRFPFTIRYSVAGDEQWSMMYEENSDIETPVAGIALDSLNGVYVAGASREFVPDRSTAWWDPAYYTTVRYRQTVTDVGCRAVVSPAGELDSGTVVTPACSLVNYGTGSHDYDVRLRIGGSYNRTVHVAGHVSGTVRYVTFPAWAATPLGSVAITCSTELSGDVSPRDDRDTGRVSVRALARGTGWVARTELPLGPKAKNVKDGGALCAGQVLADANDTGYVFAFKGNNRFEFYRYNITTNTWVALESIPALNRNMKKKGVKKGACLVFGTNGKVYATKGNSCLDLWEYTPGTSGGSWLQKADVPMGAKFCREGVGAVAVKEEGTNYIYLLKGSGTFEFYRYNADTDVWDLTLPAAPAGVSGKPYKNGSGIAYDGEDTIYAVKGSYNEFYAYSVFGRTWSVRPPLPLIGASGKKKKVKDGAGMAFFGGAVYALKGGNTDEFWLFNRADQKWYEQAQLPAGSKRVKGGGALTFSAVNKTLYAFRGNNKREFWQYWIPLGADAGKPTDRAPLKSVQTGRTIPGSDYGLRVAPTPASVAATATYSLARPGRVSLRLRDIAGRLVLTLASGDHAAGEYSTQLNAGGDRLAAGVYLLEYEAGDYRTTEKLIIE